MAHPQVLEAAVIARAAPEVDGTAAGLRGPEARAPGEPHAGRADRVPAAAASRGSGSRTTSCFVDEIPKTSVGKLDKKVLRERFKDWQPAEAALLADAAR